MPLNRHANRAGCLVALVALMCALVVPAAVAAPATPTNLPIGIEALQPYVGQTICDPVAKPGVRAFMNLVLNAYPDTGSSGIVRDCGIGGQSEHKEGRAWDWTVSYANATQRAHVDDLFAWLFATDKNGNRAAMARRLGVMYVIWNNQIWKAYQIDRGFQPYSGADPHTGHVHFSFGWNGAKQVTSFWTGKVAPIDYGPSGRQPIVLVRSPANIKILATYGATTLQSGSTGEAVKVMQTALQINPDGSFGPITKTAVSTFQSDQGLSVTGIFGPTEWRRLFPPPINPFGALERVDPALGKTVVSGWAIDADQDVPLKIHIYVDGQVFAQTTEDQPRPDLTTAYPGFTAAHGFRWTGTLTDGTHSVCVYGINVTGSPGVNAKLGCLTTVVQHSPIGRLDAALQAPTGISARGWSIDPDVVDPVAIRLTLDGAALAGPVPANGSRPDLLSHYGAYGDKHGFVIPFAAAQGTHQVCAQAANATGTPGVDTVLGCRPLVVRHDAFGLANPLGTPPGSVVVSGRALDPDTSATTSVHVYVDGTYKLAIPANATTTALPTYPAYGAGRGYSTTLALTQGVHKICSYALNVSGTPGAHTLISCQSVTVNHIPIGSFEAVQQIIAGPSIDLHGWAADPDSTQPVTVQVTVDGTRGTDLLAQGSRPDVGAVYPSLGSAHGYRTSLTMTQGTHKVCVTYVNLTGTPGSNPVAACRSVVVRHNPIGAAPTSVRVPAGVVVRGWGLDLDTTSPVTVRVLVDGTRAAELLANGGRADVGRAYPGYGTAHGFATAPLSMTEGTHNVCIQALNVTGTPGVAATVGCTKITVLHGVAGAITRTLVRTDGLAVYGYALDRDSTQPVQVHVSLDGKDLALLTANLPRPELATLWPGYGTDHGWQRLLHPTRGQHTLCARADNLAGTPGAGASIGCRTVTF